MKLLFLPIITFSSACLLNACGSSEQNYRKVAQLSGDLVAAQPVDFSFSLPNRSQLGADADLLRKEMTGYAWRIEGQGDNCLDSKIHESYGAYEDGRTYAMQLSATCNYLVNIMVGAKATSEMALTATINFQDHIKPMVDQYCVSCHEGYANFSTVQAAASSIVSHIENETMPPSAPLSGAEIALFLAWGDDGFQELDPNPPSKTVADESLATVLYRNNLNDFIMSHELMGRSSYELRRSLWIQPAGEALQLSNEQIFTFKTSTPTGSGLHSFSH